jgi:hypothetical protein
MTANVVDTTGASANVVDVGTSNYLNRSEAPGYDDILTTTAAAAAYAALADSPLFAQRATLAYTDTTAKDLFTLPSGAILIGFVVNVTTGFDDTGTDLVDIGVDGTADRFVADMDVSSTGISLVASDDEAALSADTVVQGIYAGGNTDAANGAATITAVYIVPVS